MVLCLRELSFPLGEEVHMESKQDGGWIMDGGHLTDGGRLVDGGHLEDGGHFIETTVVRALMGM